MGESYSREHILAGMIEILRDMTSDWDLDFSGDIGAGTKLVDDLGFESIDIVQLVVAIQERFRRRTMPFEELLMRDGMYVQDITVGDTVGFLYRCLNGAEGEKTA